MSHIADSVTIVQGEDRNIVMLLKAGDDLPFDLTGVTEITAKFPGTTSTIQRKLTLSEVTVLNAAGGKIQVALSESQTGAMKVGEKLGFEVMVDIGTTRKIFQFLKALNVRKQLL